MENKFSDWKVFADYLWKTIPNLEALLIINNQGNLLENRVSKQYITKHNLPSLQKIAKKVSIRFKIVSFDEELGGLATTLNIFQEHVMLVRALNLDHILIFLIQKSADMGHTIQMVNETKPEKSRSFQKNKTL